jgi:hypothetical protein
MVTGKRGGARHGRSECDYHLLACSPTECEMDFGALVNAQFMAQTMQTYNITHDMLMFAMSDNTNLCPAIANHLVTNFLG